MEEEMKLNEDANACKSKHTSIFSKPGTSNGVFPMLTMMSPVMCYSQWYGIPIVSFMASPNCLPESF
jgi:hypothetical protein